MKPSQKKMTRNKKEKAAKKALAADGQQRDWEDGRLGRDMKHAALGGRMRGNTYPTSIRLPVGLISALRELAELEGLSYQTYLKMILTRHVREHQKAG